ncbi:NUDIX domain-containing protein [Paenibacillus sp. TAB 01]|uniref:NUDIX hydrolase n=1 Tax=Paenibacillus sp. TAB 01 TaxID=3368988 RepID=UPI0037537F39
MRLKYNLCFIRQGNRLLMLNRAKPPLVGLWHGVGGKLEPGETPYASVLREVREETGIALAEARFAGVVTWEADGGGLGGMYVYIAELPEADRSAFPAPVETAEGLLAWKAVEWVTRADNQGVPAHVRHFLTPMLGSSECWDYRCLFHEGRLLSCEPLPLDPVFGEARFG